MLISFGRVTRAIMTGQKSAGQVRNLGQKTSGLVEKVRK